MEPKDVTLDIHQRVMKLSDSLLLLMSKPGNSPDIGFLALCMTLARMSVSAPPYTLKRIERFITGFRKACERVQQIQQIEQDKQWN